MNVIIREMELERDAEALARLINESDLGWPSSFTEGQPMSVEMVREWHTEQAFVAVYVAEVDGEIAGYANLLEGETGQPKEGYLQLLNVNPRFHGHSIGRKLVQSCINRAVKEGFQRHTLGTWSNNVKAVPAYKKTGHFWRPETSVWMQNYVPTILQMPICKPFFARHDWYDSYVREIKQEEDDFRWEGLKVYPMRWQTDQESLAVWIDRETQAPVAVETDEVFVAAIPSATEALHGDDLAINWRITNKTDTLQRFLIDARGADGLKMDHREAFAVQPGTTVEHVARVQVTAQAPYAKEDGNAPGVHSLITFGHHEVELFSGLRAQKPLEISTTPDQLSATPGRPQTISLQIQNRRDAEITATLRVTPQGLMSTSWQRQVVAVPAKGYLSLPLTLRCQQDGVFALEVRLTPDQKAEACTETFQIFAVGAGGVVSQATDDQVRIETQTVRLTVAGQEGRLLSGGNHLRLAARETHETVYYLVLADCLEQAKRYIVLKDA